MKFVDQLHKNWEQFGLSTRLDQLEHGDSEKWLSALRRLPDIPDTQACLGRVVGVSVPRNLTGTDHEQIQNAIEILIPWRKGSYSLFGIEIDAEWRSDFKWARLARHLDLKAKSVLDVGSGNGYFGYRMLEAGAATVTGLDSSLPAVLQAGLVNHYVKQQNVVLPVRFGKGNWEQSYDVAFSMGVLYHQRDHESHLRDLYQSLGTRGTLVLESIISDNPIHPSERYARMRNVWCIPSMDSILQSLARTGFSSTRVVDVSQTTTLEQRTTKYMPYESLREALSPTDKSLTVEGYPAPKRAIILAEKIPDRQDSRD